ncbi:hypothetical protein [Methylobacter sp. BBA5.1]|uniref:hypothetical protein n=1 Tax=Methylobacter sp. BBA5.1 TaxID=1495064 RepID=UPI00056D025B|nr:hypothetical protein [Methylobacter sp. BBA5.1]
MSRIKKHGGNRDLRNNVVRPSDSLTQNTQVETHTAQPELTQDLQECCDENLLGRAHTQWQFGDWASLTQLQPVRIENHPERGKLALLAASGYLQLGERVKAEEFLNLAREWGYNTKLISQLLIAGVYNSLGRAAALANRQPQATQHFENSVKIGEPGGDIRLLSQARISQQLNELGLLPGANGRLQQVRAIAEIKSQVSVCTNFLVNKLRPVDRVAVAFYEGLENQAVNGGDRVPFLLLDSKSLPRSGLHYLKNTLAKLLGNHFSFCEWYQEIGCCKKSPCALTGYAEHSISTGEFRMRLIKSHDLNLDDPILETGQYVQQIILVRDPLFILTSWFMLDQLHSHHEILKQHGINIQKIWLAHEKEVLAPAYRLLDEHFKEPSMEALTDWLSNKSKYIVGFMNKWVKQEVGQPSPYRHIVRYEDIDKFIVMILEDYRLSVDKNVLFEMDNFNSSSEHRFSSRDDPFAVSSERVSAFILKNSELFMDAAKRIGAMDESGYLNASYAS